MAVTAVYDLAARVLSVIEAGYAAAGVPIQETRYLSQGKPIAGCDSLVVTWGDVSPGPPAPTPGETQIVNPISASYSLIRHAALHVWSFRCLTATPQSAADMTNVNTPAEAVDARVVMTDGYLIPKLLAAAKFAGSFGDYATEVSLGPCQPMEANGMIGGCFMEVRIALDGLTLAGS